MGASKSKSSEIKELVEIARIERHQAELNNSVITSARWGNLTGLKAAISKGGKIRNSAQVAAHNGHLHVVKYLCSRKGSSWNDALYGAVCGGNFRMVEYIISNHKVDPGEYNNCLLRKSVTRGFLDIVIYLCSLPDVDPSAVNGSTLASAAAGGHLGVVKYLCSLPNVDPSADDNIVIRWAKNRPKVLEYLCSLPKERGIDPTKVGIYVESN